MLREYEATNAALYRPPTQLKLDAIVKHPSSTVHLECWRHSAPVAFHRFQVVLTAKSLWWY